MADTKVKIIGIFKDKISKGLKNIGSQLKEIGEIAKKVALGVAAGTAALVGITKVATAAGREIKQLSMISGASSDAFQEMAYGASQFGISQEKLADQLKDVNDRIGDFVQTGGGPMKDFFETIGPLVGVTIDDFKTLGGPDALQLYYTSLEKANLSQAEMVFFLESMASDLTDLQPLLANNGKLFKQNADEAKRLGLILSDVDIERLAAGDVMFKRMAEQAKMAANVVGLALLPYVSALIRAINEAANAAGGFGKVAGDSIAWVTKSLGHLGDTLRGIHVVFKGLELVALGFVATIGSVIEVITTSFAVVVDDVLKTFNVLFDAINYVTGSDLQITLVRDSDFMKNLHADGEALRNKVGEVRSELHELAMQKMPSDQLESFMFEIVDGVKREKEEYKDLIKEIEKTEAAKKKAVAAQALINAEKKKADDAAKVAAKAAKVAAKEQAKLDKEISNQQTKDMKDKETVRIQILKDKASEMNDSINAFKSIFSNFFSDIADGSKDAFGNMLDSFKNMITNMVSEALAAKVMSALFGDVSVNSTADSASASGGLLSGAFNSIFGRELGGPVQANMPYIVGEKRPELFVPKQDGTIIPNMAMAGGGSTSVSISAIDSRGMAEMFEENKFAITSLVRNTSQRYNMGAA